MNTFEEKQIWNEKMYSRFPAERAYKNKNFLPRFLDKVRVNAVLDFLEIKESDRIIEVGCEAGNLLKQLLGAKEVVGLDIVSSALENARKSIQSNKIKFVCADAANIPFEDSYFDKVACPDVLEHLNDPSKAVAEMHRIVKPTGSVVISVPYERTMSGFKRFFVKIGLFGLLFSNIEPGTCPWHIQSFNKKEICQILSKHFKIQRFKYVPIPFVGPTMVIKCSPL